MQFFHLAYRMVLCIALLLVPTAVHAGQAAGSMTGRPAQGAAWPVHLPMVRPIPAAGAVVLGATPAPRASIPPTSGARSGAITTPSQAQTAGMAATPSATQIDVNAATDAGTPAPLATTTTVDPGLSEGPAATISSTASTVSLTLPLPVGGVTPYRYQVYRSTASLPQPGAAIAGLSGTLGMSTTTVIDSGLAPDTIYYYRVLITDSAGRAAVTPQMVAVTAREPAALTLGFIGDSITAFAPSATSVSGGATTPAAVMGRLLAVEDGWHAVTVIDRAIAGTTTGDWLPSNPDGYYQAAKAAFRAAGVQWVCVMLGTNDSRAPYSYAATIYEANLQAIASDLVQSGMNVVINGPPYYSPSSGFATFNENSLALLQSYFAVIPGLADNRHVFVGALRDAFTYFAMNQGDLLPDGVHPTASGAQVLGALWAQAAQRIMGL